MGRRRIFVGIDGCSKGWVALRMNTRGVMDAGLFQDFSALMDAHRDAEVLGVDMPLGLCERGPRAADGAARAFLKGRASSVFNAPIRPVLSADTHAEATALSVRLTGKGLSQQSFNLLRKIREVDAFSHDPRLFEVHPEVSFQLMAGAPLHAAKKTWGGLQRRLALLATQGMVVPAMFEGAAHIGIDDVVDAAGAAWSARRIAQGKARPFPETTERTADGRRRIAIWG